MTKPIHTSNPKRRFRYRAVIRLRAAGLTQVEVAEITGLSFQRVGQIDRRHRQGVRHYGPPVLGPDPISSSEAVILVPCLPIFEALGWG